MPTATDLQSTVISVLETSTQDWEIEHEGAFTAETRLIADLDFESIDVVQFALDLEQALGLSGLPFEKLFIKDGTHVEDITVGEVVTFLSEEVGVTAA